MKKIHETQHSNYIDLKIDMAIQRAVLFFPPSGTLSTWLSDLPSPYFYFGLSFLVNFNKRCCSLCGNYHIPVSVFVNK